MLGKTQVSVPPDRASGPKHVRSEGQQVDAIEADRIRLAEKFARPVASG